MSKLDVLMMMMRSGYNLRDLIKEVDSMRGRNDALVGRGLITLKQMLTQELAVLKQKE
jgi:hypothetical protein